MISIFTNTLNQKYEFDGETGDNSGTFTPISSGQFGSGSSLSVDANYAVYPYNQSTKISYDGELSIELPATQAYAEDSFGVNANTMVAVTQSQNDNFLSFKNLGGFLKLQLYGDATIKSIQLEGNNGEKIAGGATVTAKYGKNPTLTMDSDATTSITLDCGAGVKLGTSSSSATEFWIVVPPVTFTKGFTITITDTEGGTMSKSTTKSYTVERNVIKTMTAFKVETTNPITPPANEIWYTSTDGKTITPMVSDFGQGVRIISNVYKDGKGVITFNGDLTIVGSSAFQSCSSLASVYLPESVITIDEFAFFYCQSLTNITIPRSVTTIGRSAFGHCVSLINVIIPDSVTSIGESAFNGCRSLTSVNIPASVTTIEKSVFYGCSSLASVFIPESIVSIGEHAFRSCSSLTSVVIPESVDSIGNSVFSGCGSLGSFYGKYASADNRCLIVNGVLNSFARAGLTSYTIPNNVTKIGDDAFSGCASLTNITIPNSVIEIGDSAFDGCRSLTNIALPNRITSIGRNTFSNCASLASITIPDSVKEIGALAFYGCNILTTFKGKYASDDGRCLVIDGVLNSFASAGLTSYAIPNGVTSIGESAFWRCSDLSRVTIPNGVTSIEYNAFYCCNSLIDIVISNSVESIEEEAFSRCGALVNITIPENVKNIGIAAFNECTSLKEVYCKPSTPPFLNGDIFSRCDKLTTIYVPSESATKYKNAIVWSEYAGKIVGRNFDEESAESSVPANQIWYTTTDGKIVAPKDPTDFGATIVSNVYKEGKGVIVFDNNVKRIGDFAFDRKYNLSSIIIPESCVEIGHAVFQSCSSLKKVSIPKSVKKIGGFAFSGCSSLEDVSIPEGVKEIMENTFQSCSNLKTVTIPSSVDNIDDTAFKLCSSIKEFNGKFATADRRALIVNGRMVAFAPAGLAHYSIPLGTTIIGDWVFHHCTTLTNIHIPEGVYEIGEGTFMSCSGLTNVTIPSSVKKIGNRAFSSCIALNGFSGKFVSEDRRSVVVDGNLLAFAPEGLSAYTIPNGVSKIGTGAFEQCVNLTSVIIPYGVIVIGESAFFRCVSLKNVYMPESISMIESMAFRSCSNLARINIPKSVVEISSYVFDGCSNLEIINSISNKPPTMGINVFEECNKLKVVNVPHESMSKYKSASGWSMYADKIVGCEFFGDYAGTEVPNDQIWYTSADESVVQTMKSAFGATIVSNVYENGRGVITCDRDIQIVGKEAFGRSPLLLGVALPESVTTIDANAFAYTGIKSITIPKNVTSIGTMAFADCRDLRSFYGKYASEDNRSLRIDGCLIAFAPAGLTYYSTPPGTTKIGDAAFWGCSNLGGIEMGEYVKEIGAEAFYGCSRLESFHLPQFVMKVGARAFAYCGGLEYITIDEYAIEIGNEAFLKCGNLTTVHCRPANPPSIGRRVFELCDKLRRIEVPHKSIDSYKTASGWSEYADKIDGDV